MLRFLLCTKMWRNKMLKTMFLLINLISNLFLNHILFEKNFNIKFIFQSHTIRKVNHTRSVVICDFNIKFIFQSHTIWKVNHTRSVVICYFKKTAKLPALLVYELVKTPCAKVVMRVVRRNLLISKLSYGYFLSFVLSVDLINVTILPLLFAGLTHFHAPSSSLHKIL